MGERAWRRGTGAARRAALDALATLVPVDCPGCGASAIGACASCRAATRAACRPWNGTIATQTDARPGTGELAVVSACEYDGIAKRLLSALKERGRTDAVLPLAALLRVSLATHARRHAGAEARPGASAVAAAPALLVPVPSRPSATRRRGFVPIELVARAASRRLVPVRALAIGSGVRDQAGLDRDARATNLAGAMRARARLDGARVVLVDDVVTTGATLREAARAIAAAGGIVTGAITIARTPLYLAEAPRDRAWNAARPARENP